MKTIYKFLEDKGLIEDYYQTDKPVQLKDVADMIYEYSVMVREEQIKYSAIGAAHHTAINVRSVPEQLDNDLKDHMNICRVQISNPNEF